MSLQTVTSGLLHAYLEGVRDVLYNDALSKLDGASKVCTLGALRGTLANYLEAGMLSPMDNEQLQQYGCLLVRLMNNKEMLIYSRAWLAATKEHF